MSSADLAGQYHWDCGYEQAQEEWKAFWEWLLKSYEDIDTPDDPEWGETLGKAAIRELKQKFEEYHSSEQKEEG